MAPRIAARELERSLGVRASWKSTFVDERDRPLQRWAFQVRREHCILLEDAHVTEFLAAFRATPAEIRRFMRQRGYFAQLWIETYVPMREADVGLVIPVPLLRFAAAAALPINSQFWVIADPPTGPSTRRSKAKHRAKA